MFNYSTSIIVISVFTQLIMLFILNSDNLIHKENKKYFRYAFFLLTIISFSEWLYLYLLELPNYNKMLIRFCLFTKHALSPLLFIMIGLAYKLKSNLKILYPIILLNFLCTLLIFSDSFYISYGNMTAYGNIFFSYFTTFTFCFLVMLKNVIDICKKYQVKSIYLISFIFICFFIVYYFQILVLNVSISALIGTTSAVFVYAFFASLVYKLDPLTNLLNRRCFNNNLSRIKNDVTILFLDLNNFKKINDTYGHNFGDYILQKISSICQMTFFKHGKIFRLGGDEFCIILNSNQKNVENLIEKFNQNLINERKREPLLPQVSIGYGQYIKGINTLEDAQNDADKMMYEVKAKMKKSI